MLTKQLRFARMAISGKQFQQRDDQHADIDYEIFANILPVLQVYS